MPVLLPRYEMPMRTGKLPLSGVKEMTAATLFDRLTRRSIDERFEAFHTENPKVFELFCRFADEARRTGRTRYSADAILHRLRWHLEIEVRDTGEEFALNNDFTSRYARLLIEEDPSFDGFFELRKLRESP